LVFYAVAIALTAAAALTGRLGPLIIPFLLLYAAHLVRQGLRLKIDDPTGALALFRSNRDAGLILFVGLVAGLWRAGW
jgi:4-hydroxybenzoate polyprenyltransferase